MSIHAALSALNELYQKRTQNVGREKWWGNRGKIRGEGMGWFDQNLLLAHMTFSSNKKLKQNKAKQHWRSKATAK